MNFKIILFEIFTLSMNMLRKKYIFNKMSTTATKILLTSPAPSFVKRLESKWRSGGDNFEVYIKISPIPENARKYVPGHTSKKTQASGWARLLQQKAATFRRS